MTSNQTTPEPINPVEKLRRRVKRVSEVLGTVTATNGNVSLALDDVLYELERVLNLKSWIDSDPAVQAFAREIIGMENTDWPACSQCGGSGYQPCTPGSPNPSPPKL